MTTETTETPVDAGTTPATAVAKKTLKRGAHRRRAVKKTSAKRPAAKRPKTSKATAVGEKLSVSAQFRAQILAYLNKHRDHPVERKEFAKHPPIAKLIKAQKNGLQLLSNILHQMASSPTPQILSHKAGSATQYALAGSGARTAAKRAAKKASTKRSRDFGEAGFGTMDAAASLGGPDYLKIRDTLAGDKAKPAQAFKIQVVKKTGNVRVQIGRVLLEVGVVEE